MNNQYFEFNIAPENQPRDKFFNRLFFSLKVVMIIVTVVIAYFAFMFINFLWFFVAISITITMVFHYFQTRFYNFYDIIFVDGFISVVKVYGNAKRRTLTRFNCKSIAKIGLVGGETYFLYIKDKEVKKHYTKNAHSSNDLAIFVDGQEKSLILLPYLERLLSSIIKIIGVQKLEKGLIEKIKNT